jgi:hypothetical protein
VPKRPYSKWAPLSGKSRQADRSAIREGQAWIAEPFVGMPSPRKSETGPQALLSPTACRA